jgi:glycerol-3-phosphate acyltransferase PlsY
MTVEVILLCFGAYLVGSLPFAYLMVRWLYGIDIRQHGTGKIGASNVYRVASKWLAVMVTIFDVGKGALMIWIAQLIGLGVAAQVAAGILTIIGHNWPVFLGFRGGGRGIFTSLGVISILSPWQGLMTLIIPYLFAPIHRVAFGVFVVLFPLPLMSWFLSQPLGIEERLPVTLGFATIAVIALFRRIAVPRTELSKKVPPAELFFNRLLFDRDIRDARVWTLRKPRQQVQGDK